MTARRMGWVCGVALFLLFGALSVVGCGSSDPWPQEPGKVRVLASFPAIASLAKAVGGDDVVVLSLMTTTGPHDFDGKPGDALKVRGAQLFVVNGLGLESRCDPRRLKKVSGNTSVKIVELGEAIKEKIKSEPHDHDHDHGHEGHHHHHGEFDPHVWLSPRCAFEMVQKLQAELEAIDPAHAAGYRERADKLNVKLMRLEEFGKNAFQEKKEPLVSFHESLAYFAEEFKLKVAGVIETLPGTEPSPKYLTDLVNKCKSDPKNPARVIAVEPQFPNNTAATALKNALKANGIDPVFAEVDTLETAAEADITADWYEKKMRENIEKLAAALR